MSQDNQVKSDQTVVQSDASNQVDETNVDVTVNRTPEEYARRVVELSSENKKRKEREQSLKKELDERDAKLRALETEKLQSQGKWEEIAKKAQDELSKERDGNKQLKTNYAYKVVKGHVATEAAKSGCVDTDALVELATAKGMLDGLEVDGEFNVSQDSVKAVIEQAQKQMSYLFGKPAPRVEDVNPKNPTITQSNPLEKMTLNEKINKLASMTPKA